MRRICAVVIATSLMAAPLAFGQSTPTGFSLTQSSLIGGSRWEQVRDVYHDAAGFTYIVGGTDSRDFPGALNAYAGGSTATSDSDTSFGGSDAYVTKLGLDGQILWTRLLGGPNYDRAYAVEVDAAGNVYVGGRAGKNFGTVNAFQSTFSGTNQPSSYGNQNAFIAKLSGNGDVQWSSYFGTGELVRDLAIDAAGDVYVPMVMSDLSTRTMPTAFNGKMVGTTTPGNTQADAKGDVGVAKIKSDGSAIQWATWVSGNGDEGTNVTIRVSADGKPYILFNTTGGVATAANGYQQTYGGGAHDVYVAAVKADGTGLNWGTYVGGTGNENFETHSLNIDANGNAYVAVYTTSTNIGVTTGTNVLKGANDGLIVKLGPDGQKLAARLLGGTGGENPDGIYIGSDRRVYISGETAASDFPVTAGSIDTSFGGVEDGFFVVLSADLTSVDYGTYIGTNQYDGARTMFLAADGKVYLGGGTSGNGVFTLVNPADSTWANTSSNNNVGNGEGWFWVLTPTPEPSCLAGVMVGTMLLLRRVRRQSAAGIDGSL